MPEFSDIPEHLRQRIINMAFLTPTGTFNNESCKQLSPLVHDAAPEPPWDDWLSWSWRDEDEWGYEYNDWKDEDEWGYEYDDWRNEEDRKCDRSHDEENGSCEYDDWRDQEYSDCIKIDGVRHHNAVFYSCGRLKRLND